MFISATKNSLSDFLRDLHRSKFLQLRFLFLLVYLANIMIIWTDQESLDILLSTIKLFYETLGWHVWSATDSSSIESYSLCLLIGFS